MKKIIMGVAAAAILSTNAFSAEVLDLEGIKSGIFDTIYVETSVGVNNGNNDMILTIGSRDIVHTDLLGVGMVDLSATGSMEGQYDVNARYTTGMIEGMSVFGSIGAESFNTRVTSMTGGGAPECITYSTDANGDTVCKVYGEETFASETSEYTKTFNLYGEIGAGTLITPNWGVMSGIKIGTEKIDLYTETFYQVDSEIYVTIKAGQTVFSDSNDNQHEGLTALMGVGYSF